MNLIGIILLVFVALFAIGACKLAAEADERMKDAYRNR